MSGTLSSPAQGPAVGSAVTGRPSQRFGWRQLQLVAAVIAVASFVIPMLLTGQVEGFLMAMAAPFVLGLAISWRWPRAGAATLGVVSIGILGSSAPFLVDALLHPEAAADFIPLFLLVVATIVGGIAAVPAYREARRTEPVSSTARTVLIAAGAVTVVAAALSLVAAGRLEQVSAQPGDVSVLTRDFAFAPAKLSASAGTVAVHLTNDDSTRHTFTIDGVTDVSVPPTGTARVTFEAEPGTYRFFCEPHDPTMDGVLVVE
jgi:plastocyanin